MTGISEVLIVKNKGFDIDLCNAAQTTRLGYKHGFEELGIEVALVLPMHLGDAIRKGENPLVWLCYDDYNYIGDEGRKVLRDAHHIVQVNTWFDGMEKLHKRYNAPSPVLHPELLKRILDSEPDFVWCSAPEAFFGSYEGWDRAGMKVVSLPWACDTRRYYPEPENNRYDEVEVAFVGGYRPYKEPQYEDLLWPYEKCLSVFGYSRWPYAYRGMIPYDDERVLYQNATVCPSISEPQFVETGDTVERPFKILGSGGLTICDCRSVYKELFSLGEVPTPRNLAEYYEMMDLFLTDISSNLHYRQKGRNAVLERHTYKHRAQKILSELAGG